VPKELKGVLEPGEQTTLELEFNPAGKISDVVQWADVLTNDPLMPTIRFELIGQTIRKVWASGTDFLFTDLQPDEERTSELLLYSIFKEGFNLTDIVAQPEGVKVESEPLPAEALEKQKAPSGYLLRATYPKHLGSTDGYIEMSVQPTNTEEPKPERIRFALRANRLGLLSMFGPVDDVGRIEVGQLPQGKGKTVSFTLKARGADRLLKFKSLQVEPEVLKVTLTPSDKAAENGLHTLTIEIPPETPVMSRLGKDGGRINIVWEQEYYNTRAFDFTLSFAVVPAVE
jgi:hypothetical protein